jgi:RNase P subunit RPR2
MENKLLPIPITQCPHCGSEEGYYTKTQVSGTARYYCHYDGSEAHNEEMYDSLVYKESKYAYCSECHKRLFKTLEIETTLAQEKGDAE